MYCDSDHIFDPKLKVDQIRLLFRICGKYFFSYLVSIKKNRSSDGTFLIPNRENAFAGVRFNMYSFELLINCALVTVFSNLNIRLQ